MNGSPIDRSFRGDTRHLPTHRSRRLGEDRIDVAVVK